MTNKLQHIKNFHNQLKRNERTDNNFIKFIHASDLHLGCQQYRNINRSEDFINAFSEILEIAVNYQVDFILLAGDVFTSIDILPGIFERIIRILMDFKTKTNANIPIIVIEGNHDLRRYSRGMKFEQEQSWLKVLARLDLILLLDADFYSESNNIFLYYDFERKKGGKIQIKNVIIYGTRYLGENPKEYIHKINESIDKDDGLFHILLMHLGIEGQMENVPGIKLKDILILKERVHYLGLGHYHKQFIMNNWIFNPGSLEAASPIDSSYQRGIFFIKVDTNRKFKKSIYPMKLINRNHIWETIFLHIQFKNIEDVFRFIFKKLITSENLNNNESTTQKNFAPILNIILKGKKPRKFSKNDEKELRNLIIDNLSVIDVKVYQKFNNNIKTIDKYL